LPFCEFAQLSKQLFLSQLEINHAIQKLENMQTYLSLLLLGGLTMGLAIGGVLYLLFTCGCIFLVGPGCGIWFAAVGYIGIILTHFGGLIWATVKVFSSYNEWTYENKTSETYCEYTPFVFAMIVLIVNWILLLVRARYEVTFNRSTTRTRLEGG
jgi:hypothetical protein